MLILLGAVLIIIGALLLGLLGPANSSLRSDMLSGSVILSNDTPASTSPVALNLATGSPEAVLSGLDPAIGASAGSPIVAVAESDATLLLNPSDGEYNYLSRSGLLVGPTEVGVKVSRSKLGTTSAFARSAGRGSFIIRTGPDGSTYDLVDQSIARNTRSTSQDRSHADTNPTASVAIPRQHSEEIDPSKVVARDGVLWGLFGSWLRTVSSDGTKTLQHHDENLDITGPSAIDAFHPSGRAPGAVVASLRGFSFANGSDPSPVELPAPSKARTIEPVTNGLSEALFAFREGKTWTLRGIEASSATAATIDPVRLAVPRGTTDLSLASAPGGLFGVARTKERTVIVGFDRTTGESLTFRDERGPTGRLPLAFDPTKSDIIVAGRRVIINPWTDDQGATITAGANPTISYFDKTRAVTITPSQEGGVSSDATTTTAPGSRQKTKAVRPTVNQLCQQSRYQRGSIEVSTLGDSSRSIPLQLSYTPPSIPCYPRAYLFEIGPSGKAAPSLQSVPTDPADQASTAATITGLEPGTDYSITVWATFANQDQRSNPQRFTYTTSTSRASAPQNPEIVQDGPHSAKVSWGAPGDLGGQQVARYRIEVCPSGSTSSCAEDHTQGLQLSFQGLKSGESYMATVWAEMRGRAGSTSNLESDPGRTTSSALIIGTPLQPWPPSVGLLPPQPGEDPQFTVSRRTTEGCAGAQINSTCDAGNTDLTYRFSSMQHPEDSCSIPGGTMVQSCTITLPASVRGQPQDFIAFAVGGSCPFEQSCTSVPSTPSSASAPSKPSVTFSSPPASTDTSITISWSIENGGSPLTAGPIVHCSGGSLDQPPVQGATTGTSTCTGLNPNTGYTLTVTATNAVGDSDPGIGTTATITTMFQGPSPQGTLQVEQGEDGNSLNLSWAPFNSHGAPTIAYAVTVASTSGGDTSKAVTDKCAQPDVDQSTQALTCFVTGLDPGATYTLTLSGTTEGTPPTAQISATQTTSGTPPTPGGGNGPLTRTIHTALAMHQRRRDRTFVRQSSTAAVTHRTRRGVTT